jgi:hypothetical protein
VSETYIGAVNSDGLKHVKAITHHNKFGSTKCDTYVGTLDSCGDNHGKGKMSYANGDVYDGDWKKGKKEGKGQMWYNAGDNRDYDYGDWAADKYHGK